VSRISIAPVKGLGLYILTLDKTSGFRALRGFKTVFTLRLGIRG
jgi:hypothetical protein